MVGEDPRVATTVWEPRGISGRAAKERGDLHFQPNDIKAKPGQNAVRRNARFDATANCMAPQSKGDNLAKIDDSDGADGPAGSGDAGVDATSSTNNLGQPPPHACAASNAGAPET